MVHENNLSVLFSCERANSVWRWSGDYFEIGTNLVGFILDNHIYFHVHSRVGAIANTVSP